MTNAELFRSTFFDWFGTNQRFLAKLLGVSDPTITNKINSEFTIEEMYKLRDRYRLSQEEAEAIFLYK